MDLSEEKIKLYFRKMKGEMDNKFEEFSKIKHEKNEHNAFKELVFCLLTPQSKAEICWKAVVELEKHGFLFSPTNTEEIETFLRGIRFKKNKAKYIDLAKKMFLKDNTPTIFEKVPFTQGSFVARKWLIKNVRGLGFKEASHFLRNIGFYENIAILDRHILRCLKSLGVINEIPKTISEKKYIEIEEKMRKFSKTVSIPMHYLDFLLWYLRTGRIFK